MPRSKEAAQANLENLHRIFTVPEAPDSTLGSIDRDIAGNVAGFLQTHVVALERKLIEIEQDFSNARVPEEPTFVSDYTEFLTDKLVAQSVNTASPAFIGHMTSAFPYFMLPLSRIMIALNQNLVKVETSKAFTPMERQVLAMIHRLVYDRDDDFYGRWMHDPRHALGAFCSGGTVANITALWAARNRLCGPSGEFRGIAREGLAKALRHLDCAGLAVLVSRRAHYSLGKAVDLLGIGRDNLVAVETDENSRIDLQRLREESRRLQGEGMRVLALVGIGGTTETGNVDPLEAMADFAQELNCHFHVDSAWGGPTLFSRTYRPLLRGIERADSVTIDAHKQLYVPMGAGMVVFKDPETLASIEHHAAYIIRRGSKDLGSHTLEGSRPGMAMLVHAGLSIIGRKGYELLMDGGIERARHFAGMIENHPDFELVTVPELNILTYRYVPAWLQQDLARADAETARRINARLDRIIETIQKRQRAAGNSFVSRTRLALPRYRNEPIIVFRSVLANPLTTDEILASVLEEQVAIAAQPDLAAEFAEIMAALG
ncbi:pyridoxal-dependent aspartate 1-decarboxylase PanP [Trichloromonas acetexigens]|uniref:Putative pyridoxal-dependent aspartate 1-decarboxylase n=1 Tax=Trichloromonas acetexigens TaxID=38815 RepID=A0A550JIZ2_9BACT|nr:putative pyridoxal-dependent aspartate 1-decarboxylase [Desulfuromonas acetexigens]TRO83168.1 putative pyridoxal-dependent aspartate 1-decarboxylase [Desulfuromonas acetexigens]